MGSPEDIKTQVILDQDCNRNFASGSAPSSHDIICEPVPIESKPSPVVSGSGQTQSKWKNAFGFVYQVRKRLSNQPQIYNDFIDIMRKVHNQTIDTADVVTVISDLFKDHPDLIRGFNAFLPDKHKIDVKVQLRVAVSGIPSPDSPSGDPNERDELPITTRIIRFTLNVRKRFEDDEKRPEKYKRFVEVLYLYKALSQQLQGLRKCKKTLKEEDVYAEVRKLFENNEDLLQEFSEYLPYNKKLSDIYKDSYKYSNEDMPYNCSCCSDVSSSEQTDIKKDSLNENMDVARANDEVTSSVDTGLDNLSNGISLQTLDIKDIKKFDVSSSHLNIKTEILDINDYAKNYQGESIIDQDLNPLIIPKKEHIKCFIDGNGEDCDNELVPAELNVNNIDLDRNQSKFRPSDNLNEQITELENSLNINKNESFIKCEEDSENYFSGKYSLEDNGEIDDDSMKCRTPRKPLTPFKVPLPPLNKIINETKSSFKRLVNDEYSPTGGMKLSAVVPVQSPSPSPPEMEMETSVITRLAKRAALASPDEDDESANDVSSPPRQLIGGTPGASPAPKSSSDKRLRNLRKRLRRLANL